MTRRVVPGRLDLHALAALAHRPSDPKVLAREATALIAQGLTVPDAARALGLSAAALAQLLTNHPTGD